MSLSHFKIIDPKPWASKAREGFLEVERMRALTHQSQMIMESDTMRLWTTRAFGNAASVKSPIQPERNGRLHAVSYKESVFLAFSVLGYGTWWLKVKNPESVSRLCGTLEKHTIPSRLQRGTIHSFFNASELKTPTVGLKLMPPDKRGLNQASDQEWDEFCSLIIEANQDQGEAFNARLIREELRQAVASASPSIKSVVKIRV